MDYNQIMKKYPENGITNCKFKTKDDLKNVLGIDVDSIKGIEKLGVNREMFEGFLINFFNRWGLEERERIIPISVMYKKNRSDGAYLKFVYERGEKQFLHVKGVNHFY